MGRWLQVEAGAQARVSLDGPTAMNLLTLESLVELHDALVRLQDDAGIRVLILQGAGERAFCAGADLSDLPKRDPAETARFVALGTAIWQMLEDFPAPTLAVVQGPAYGAGLELALACDLRLAGPQARLGQPALRLGLIPPFAAARRWQSFLGRGRANQLLLLGRELDAETAERWGLVDGVSDDLAGTSAQWAARLAACAPAQVRDFRRWLGEPDPAAEAAALQAALLRAQGTNLLDRALGRDDAGSV